jgi:ceramide glucosyltransferase
VIALLNDSGRVQAVIRRECFPVCRTDTAMAAMLGMKVVWVLLLALALVGTVSSTVFLGMVLAAAVRYRRLARQAQRKSAESIPDALLPPVSVLKPVHGMEPHLSENLESFFRQNYPKFEIIIGARDLQNPALQVAQQVRARYPQVKSQVVLSGPPAWPSAKVFSLDKMIGASSNSYFIISDSDVIVRPDFLRQVIPPLLNSQVGLVTCLYRGIPASDFWSLLESLGMSVEMPSGVLVADMMEGMRFALGAAMALRRDTLDAIGGIASTADYYSDDFVLGNEVWAAGYKVVLSHEIVGHVLLPRTLKQTFGDQLRWMKSTRYSRPKGHVGTGLTYAMPFGVLGLMSAAGLGHLSWGIALLLTAYFNRLLQSVAVGWGIIRDPRALKYAWLYPLRDLMGFVFWARSFSSSHFSWRGEIYQFVEGGKIIPQHRHAEVVSEERR